MAGQTQVWIAFRFKSNESISGLPGAFVDDVVIQKDVMSTAPDLLPFQPLQWNYTVPIGTSQLTFAEAHSEDGPFYDTQILYFNHAILNQGGATAYSFRVRLEVTGTGGGVWNWDIEFANAGGYGSIFYDQPIGRLSAGPHTVKLWVDYLNAVAETNEGNNYYERTINVLATPIEFFAECADNENFGSPRDSGWVSSSQYSFTNLNPDATYWYRVKARQSGIESAWSNVEYSRQTSVLVTSLTPSPAVPQQTGTAITWTVAATGGTATLQYKFWVYSSSSGAWTMMHDYSSTNTYVWTPAQAGRYQVAVWVRSSGQTADYDAFLFSGYFDITAPVLPSVTLSASPSVPQVVGTPITWTAVGSGAAEPMQYKFWVYSSAEAKWTMMQDYSTTNSYSWTPTLVGRYQVGVWLRIPGSTAAYDAYKFSGYFDVAAPAPSVYLTASPQPPNIVGAPMTFTATGSGCDGPPEYRFYVYSSAEAKWTMMQDYSTTNTFSWVPALVGQYQVGVWLHIPGSAAPYDAYRFSGYFSITNPQTVTLSASPAPPQRVGTQITWTATGMGGSAPLQYKFWVYSSAEAKWTMMQDYSTTNTYSWTPTQAGQYQVAVWLRSSGSTAPYDTYQFSGYFIIWPEMTIPNSDASAKINYGATMHFHVTAMSPVGPLLKSGTDHGKPVALHEISLLEGRRIALTRDFRASLVVPRDLAGRCAGWRRQGSWLSG